MGRSTHRASAEESAEAACMEITAGSAAALRWQQLLPPATADAGQQTRWLAQTIETEIIPRLMLAHRSAPDLPDADAAELLPASGEQIEALTRHALGADAGAALAYVRSLRVAGLGLEAIYLQLLAPTARHLGVLWENDLCSFADVTVALWRLQQVMHEMSAAFQNGAAYGREAPRRAVLVPVPGSQHTLGLFMVAEFFRRAGWYVWGDMTVSERDIVDVVRGEWFDIIGMSVGAETQVDRLASVILAAREASRNRGLVVIIGGPIVTLDPTLVARVGADATAQDAPSAVSQAEQLVAGRAAVR